MLGMHLNRITVLEAATVPGHAGSKKSYEVDDADFFWSAHGREQFPKIAEQVRRAGPRWWRAGGGCGWQCRGGLPWQLAAMALQRLQAA